ncbi:MAG: tRNA pseudouridine(38-40) synthase TruA [Ruminococcaceae bacterium]|nr:tRNA pseudouridine(38-40) synthase TruA [Oscillospiraceae bacterium]
MRNFKLLLEYDGTRYKGWQKQGNTEQTISAKFEAMLQKMLNQKIEVHGSGRTDAGVHALGQVAHFKADTSMTTEEIHAYLNEYLPLDIRVLSVEEMPLLFHSRLHAKKKTYCYHIYLDKKPPVFMRHQVFCHEGFLDIKAMKQGAALLLGTHDFQSFCATKKGKKSTVRTLYECQIEQEAHMLTIRVTGNGFLYHMVRILAGTLVEIGEGTREWNSLSELLEAKDRSKAGKTLPACGVTLINVDYEEDVT